MSSTYNKKIEVYITKTIIEYDEYNNIMSRNVYYDKEVKYEQVETKKVEPKYYSYEILNKIPVITNPIVHNSNDCVIDMSKVLYNNAYSYS